MIKTIDRGKVVLSVNGKDEVLTLKDRKGGGAAYKPSAADFYKEPVEPAQPKVNNNQPNSGTRRPAVRPRPVRRSSNPSSPGHEVD